ncbi:DUF7144 family membrane protein [Saccharomonospora iraqiensis]|uniref:DUF7144 family membrane protein n=1 Tax=Saccharomonospora iraqiensis TaxID=52698 RepID=UPI00047BAB8A|nr:hypothetical protein [Saccharomonospora iraqiensis]
MSETSQNPQAQQTERVGTQRVPPQTRGQDTEAVRARTEGPSAAQPGGQVFGGPAGIMFASSVLGLIGAFQLIVGLTTILNSAFYGVAESNLALNLDYAIWGWVHLGIGALAVVTALALFSGQTWARVAGIAIASISAIVSMAFIPAFPVWALTIIAVDVVAIYAIAVHGRRSETS